MSVVAVKRSGTIFLFVAMLVAFIFLTQYVIFVMDRLPWFDVAFSLETVEKMKVESIDFSQYDVHVPTFYVLLYGWSYLNPGISFYHWSQELSVLFVGIFLVFAFFGLKKMFGDPGMYAAFGLALMSTYVHFGTEVRVYGFLLMLSGILFYAVAKRLNGLWLWVAAAIAFLLPLSHYLAIMAVPFFVLMYVVRERFLDVDWLFKGKEKYVRPLFILLCGLLGTVISYAVYLIPQRERIVGMWLPTSTFGSWPSSIMFTFLMTDGLEGSPFLSIVYFAFIAVMIGLLLWMWFSSVKIIKDQHSKESVENITLMYMLAVQCSTVVGIVLSQWINIYHHRFFLLVTWCFAAASFVILARIILEKRKLYSASENSFFYLWKVAVVGVLIIMFVVGVMFAKYTKEQKMGELKNLMAAMPCDGSGVIVMHESPFSSLPFQVYSRENECNWRNVISTDLDKEQANSAGYDVIPAGDIYWNLTIPKSSFYYVRADDNYYKLEGNLSNSIVLQDNGVALMYVRQKPLVSVDVR